MSKPNRFDYVAYDLRAIAIQAEFKAKFQELEALAETHFPAPARAKALLLTSLEEAYMWAGKQIRDDLLIRKPGIELQEQRSNQ